MKIQRETKIEETNQAAFFGFQEIPFEIPLEPSIRISETKKDAPRVDAPVDHHAAMQASALIRQLFLAQPLETVMTQANANRKKVAMLLAEE